MAITGKTGADAIFKALSRICIVLNRYHAKLINVVSLAQAAGAITSGEATTIIAFINAAQAACDAFRKLADYAGF